MMINKSLYLVQSNYSHTPAILDKVEKIHCVNDDIVLMGDAVLFATDTRLMHKKNIYILSNDAEILLTPIPSHIIVLNYMEFADLILKHDRCISFK